MEGTLTRTEEPPIIMADQEKEVDSLLSEDAFQNEKSQKLFEAIDEFRNTGIAAEIGLPEVDLSITGANHSQSGLTINS